MNSMNLWQNARINYLKSWKFTWKIVETKRCWRWVWKIRREFAITAGLRSSLDVNYCASVTFVYSVTNVTVLKMATHTWLHVHWCVDGWIQIQLRFFLFIFLNFFLFSPKWISKNLRGKDGKNWIISQLKQGKRPKNLFTNNFEIGRIASDNSLTHTLPEPVK